MKHFVAVVILLAGLLTSVSASAESMPLEPCTCNDDCEYQGGWCNDLGWGLYCESMSPGIPCTDGGIPDGGSDADLDGAAVLPDRFIAPEDVWRPWDSRPPEDVSELQDGDVGPMSANRGCTCDLGQAPLGARLPLWLLVIGVVFWMCRRCRRSDRH